ncbi:MAG: trypsin-like peptidase domain-containing protein, partial [Phycisphaerales bacterium]|nr:trypsin-like peptidase domain-containing protein [Phycisphaerales bacterium]
MHRYLLVVSLVLGLSAARLTADPVTKDLPPPPAAILNGPKSLEDLKVFQKHTRALVERITPATVCLLVGGASGSGVIVSEDGLILTAGHVSGEPNRPITVVLHDGRRVKGMTLGRWSQIDSGMAKITEPGPWPYCELGVSKDLKPGQWCLAAGHPGGFKNDRPPVIRVGKIGLANAVLIQSDCTLVGGDSGGPLFDMSGKVIGIHSRIGTPLTANIHVPVDTYRETWDQLVKGEKIGETQVWLGVRADVDAKNCRLGEITPDSPAERAGLKAGDVILKFDGTEVASYADMVRQLQKRKPGEEVDLEVRRGDEILKLKVVLGK